MESAKALLLLAAVQSVLRLARGHGYLAIPGARNSAWRLGFPTPVQYTDNQLNCGGFGVQYGQNGGRCGVCGDAWNEANTGAYVYPGMYATNTITATYTRGQVIDVTVRITANHKGFFVFRIGDIVSGEITQEKLIHKLAHLDGSTEWRIPADHPWDFTQVFHLRLPSDLVCQHCVLQWWYTCGNNWGSQQETFVNCADVAITAGGIVVTTPRISSTTPTTARTTIVTTQSTTRTTATTTTTQTPTTTSTTAATTTTRTPTTTSTTAATTTTRTPSTISTPATTTAKATTTTATPTGTTPRTTTISTTKAVTTPTVPTTRSRWTRSRTPYTTSASTTTPTTKPPNTTTPKPTSVTCVGTAEKRATYPSVDEFCSQNCPLGYCPSTWCVCDGNPVSDDGCYAIGERIGAHYDYLCRRMCMFSSECPLHRCSSACANLFQGK